jgi:NhaA family Na+:H+ antiporter
VALPIGKLVGIAGAGWLAQRLLGGERIALGDLVAAGALGGIGFTVSLLLANLAFAQDAALRDGAILGVLAGSLVALVLAAALVSWRARIHRRRKEAA